MEEPDGLPSMGLHRVGYDWSDLAAAGLAFRVRATKTLLRPMSMKSLPIFPSRNFTVSDFTFKSLVDFEFIFVYGVK